jgi:hypothetical protein
VVAAWLALRVLRPRLPQGQRGGPAAQRGGPAAQRGGPAAPG